MQSTDNYTPLPPPPPAYLSALPMFCSDGIFWTTQPFAARLGINHEPVESWGRVPLVKRSGLLSSRSRSQRWFSFSKKKKKRERERKKKLFHTLKSTVHFAARFRVMVRHHKPEYSGKKWIAIFHVEFTARDQILRKVLFLPYLLNCWTFHKQFWSFGVSSWTTVYC